MTTLSPLGKKKAADEFQSKGYTFVESYLDPLYVDYLATQLINAFQKGQFSCGDKTVPNCFFINGGALLDSLLFLKCEEASFFYGEPMLPLYSYCRVYPQGTQLSPHKDNPTLECSITCNIHGTHLYPFYVVDPTTQQRIQFRMQPGDAVMIKGTDVEHGRDVFDGFLCFQVFLHYVRKNGPYADRLYDGRNPVLYSAATFDKVGIWNTNTNTNTNTKSQVPSYVQMFDCPEDIYSMFEMLLQKTISSPINHHQPPSQNQTCDIHPSTFRITATDIPSSELPEACMTTIQDIQSLHFNQCLDHVPTHKIDMLCQLYHVSEGGYIQNYNSMEWHTLYHIYLNMMDAPFTIEFTQTKDVVQIERKKFILIPSHYTYAYRSWPHATGGVLLTIRAVLRSNK